MKKWLQLVLNAGEGLGMLCILGGLLFADGACAQGAPASGWQQAIVPMNSITIVQAARSVPTPRCASSEKGPPAILIFALAILAALGAAGIIYLLSLWGWIR